MNLERITWDALEARWLTGRFYAGPTEKWDYEQEWHAFRARHEEEAPPMIPDHLIDKAAAAILEAAFGQELPEAPIDLARAALEAVAADIWDEGWEQGMAYVVGMERGTDDDHAITNPYRASEGK